METNKTETTRYQILKFYKCEVNQFNKILGINKSK